MYTDDARHQQWKEIEVRLITVCEDALTYFASLQSDGHREAWNSLLLLLLTRCLRMPEERFQAHIRAYYTLLCEIMIHDLKPELRAVLKKVFVRVAPTFGITK
jgi:brefeldin A-inhibited guanine nucleotide-exchange protein